MVGEECEEGDTGKCGGISLGGNDMLSGRFGTVCGPVPRGSAYSKEDC